MESMNQEVDVVFSDSNIPRILFIMYYIISELHESIWDPI